MIEVLIVFAAPLTPGDLAEVVMGKSESALDLSIPKNDKKSTQFQHKSVRAQNPRILQTTHWFQNTTRLKVSPQLDIPFRSCGFTSPI